MNHIDHRERALSHLAAVAAHQQHLDDEYASGKPRAHVVAESHQAIRTGLKMAEVHALLALAPAAPSDGGQGQVLLAERFGVGSRLA